MTRFKLGQIWERQNHGAATDHAYIHVQTELPEMWEWLSETGFMGFWTISAVMTGAFEYDTGFCCYDVIIDYSDETDAVLHRFRW